MKKRFALLLTLVLLTVTLGASWALAEEAGQTPPPLPPHIKDQVDVVAVFAGPEKQPLPMSDRPEDDRKIDTVWIYFSDNTFDQYAEIRHEFELFSTGTYAFTNGGSFGADGRDGSIVINRTQKYSEKDRRMAAYSSSHEYKLGSLGFAQIYGPDEGRAIEAVTGDNKHIEYMDEAGVRRRLDSIWLYFTDGTFKDFVFLNGEVVPNGEGTYAFDETGDFHIVPTDKDHGTITISWDKSLKGLEGETRVYDLSTWSEFLYEKHDPSVLPPAGAPPEGPVPEGVVPEGAAPETTAQP